MTVVGGKKPVTPTDYAECRSLGHSWRHNGKPLGPFSDGVVGLVSKCSECGAERTKWISRSGALGPNSYRYPENYSQHGDDRLTTVEWRRTFVVTLFGER